MPLREIPDRYLGMIIHFLMSFHNDTSEFSRPHLRKSFQNSYIFIVIIYSCLIITGFVANVILIRNIFVRREFNISMYKYLAFNALNDIVKCVVILPLALSTTLFQNWFYGSFFCYLFPMIQDIPFHATMLTLLLITFDRYRRTLYPLKQPFSYFFSMLGVWITTVFAVLPYAVYTRYLDLESYFGNQFKGTGICAINLDDNIEEYIRCLFIIMYVLPLGLIAFLHVKASEEIKAHQTAFTVSYHDVSISHERENDSVSSLNSNATPENAQARNQGITSMTLTVPKAFPNPRRPSNVSTARERSLHIESSANDDNKDWNVEKKLQAFLATSVTAYGICLLPLNLVRLFKHVVYETYENSFQFDIIFITVVWIAFVPTVTTPVIFQFWQKSGLHNSNIRRYLRLGRASDVSFSSYDLQRSDAKTTNETII